MSAVPFLAALAGSLPRGSTAARSVDTLFGALLLLTTLVVFALVATNGYFLVRYRRGSAAPRPPARFRAWQLEAGWITATTLVFLALFAWGARVYLEIERPPANATEITVVGRQWMWDVRHANGRREFDTLHVPVNEPIRLRLSSEDVIHSFFVPAFRVKQDVVPGKTVSLWFEATRPGTYHLFCAQYCGTQHAGMTGEVIVQTPEEHAAWLASGSVDGARAGRGRRLFIRYGCSGCHEPNATVRAPSLAGLFGRTVPLEGGAFAPFDEAYVRDAILEPNKQVAAGYAAVMPSFKGVITEGDLLEIVDYLKAIAATPAAEPTQP